MSTARRISRQKSRTNKGSTKVQQALPSLLAALPQLEGLQGDLQALQSLGPRVGQVSVLLDTLVGDYQGLSDQQEVLFQMIRLLSGETEEEFMARREGMLLKVQSARVIEQAETVLKQAEK